MTTLALNPALDIFQEHLCDIKVALIHNLQYDISQLQPFQTTNDPTYNLLANDLNNLQIKQTSHSKALVLKRIIARQQYQANPNQKGVSQEQIETAHDYPIQDLFQEITSSPVRRGMVSCPFHKDSNASMSLQKYNRYRCFSCQDQGSTIDLYMKVNDVDFLTAVRALQ